MFHLYPQRRQRVMDLIGGGTAVFASAPTVVMHNDVEHPFRQDSNFYYLTGFNEPEAVAVLAPHHEEHRFVLFVRPKDQEKETWSGYRIGVEQAKERYGADAVYPIAELDEHLPKYLEKADRLYYHFGHNQRLNEAILRHWQQLLSTSTSGGPAPSPLRMPSC